MNKTATLTAGVAAMVLAGCSASGTSPHTPQTVANISSSSLQMNVGTANLFGLGSGLNVAVTYRQTSGNPGASATLVNSPTLTLPTAITAAAGTADGFGSTILSGPATAEIGTTSMTSTSQAPNASATTTFGNDGGAFGLGIEPFNYVAPLGQAGVTGKPANVTPYPVPLYDTLAGTDPNAFIPGGGPPAFNIAGNAAAVQAGFNAISEGLDVFAIPPVVGTYSLNVSVPANTGTVSQTATAAITSAALLPVFAPPVTTVNADGTATLAVVLPAGVTEAYLQITDFGPTATGAVSCVGATAGAPVYYTIEVTASGTATLPASASPVSGMGPICSAPANTTASGAASDGDAFTVQAVGFDYPAYEASYPNSLGKPSPTLTGSGASHQADITVSLQTIYNIAAGNAAAPGGALPSGHLRVNAVTRK